MEFISLGTGASCSVPSIDCLTAEPPRQACRTCRSALTPEGKKNVRRNISSIVRMPSPKDPQRSVTILIDAGKDFRQSALELFPKYKLRRIDALLLTHAHADAINGLDDLRSWTMRGFIQDDIEIYLGQDTFDVIKRSFPYMISAEHATGGGNVPTFKWNVIQEGEPFEVAESGITVEAFAVHHGRIFGPAPVAKAPPGSMVTAPSTPKPLEDEVVRPFFCFAYRIYKDIVLLTDVNHIPDNVWPQLFPNSPAMTGKPLNDIEGRLPLLILDCLYLKTYPAHLSLGQAYEHARRISAKQTYLVGMDHTVSHEEYTTIAEVVEGRGEISDAMSYVEKTGIHDARDGLSAGTRLARVSDENQVPFIRPAYDGLRLMVADGEVRDMEQLSA
ncbi:beta-lactamase-like protein [Flagelloscypha sp. PMI_526]|nr:beta-lactamase-like protein [Flagelloscypha sp. PMI_526]